MGVRIVPRVKIKKLKLADITVSPDVQSRDGKQIERVIEEYADVLRDGNEFKDKMVVYWDAKARKHWLSEGFYRYAAYQAADFAEAECEVRIGDKKAAIINSCGSNVHGEKRTNADKRRAVLLLIKLKPGSSHREIAKLASVSHQHVVRIRDELQASIQTSKQPSGVSQCDTQQDKANNTTTPQVQSQQSVTEKQESTSECGDDKKPAQGDSCSSQKANDSGTVDEPQKTPETVIKIEPVPVDGWGIPIQPHAVQAFTAISQFKELIAAIQKAQRLFNEVANLEGGKFLQMKGAYRRGAKDEDGNEVARWVHSGLETAYQQAKASRPTYTICPYQFADIPHSDRCTCCAGLNWTPELGSQIPPDCIARAKAKFAAQNERGH